MGWDSKIIIFMGWDDRGSWDGTGPGRLFVGLRDGTKMGSFCDFSSHGIISSHGIFSSQGNIIFS